MTSRAACRVLLSETQVRALLAHREPFLMIRHAIENKIGVYVTAVARQSDQLQLPSQFHLLEGLGQTSALLIRQMPRYGDKTLPVFAAMKNVIWKPCTEKVGVVLYNAKFKRAVGSRFGIVDACAQRDSREAKTRAARLRKTSV